MKRYAPVFTLAFLAPFIAEFLFGATPISRIAGFVFLLLLYGGGPCSSADWLAAAAGWERIAVLGAAYACHRGGISPYSHFSIPTCLTLRQSADELSASIGSGANGRWATTSCGVC
jgi:hypothetical protein